MNILNREQKVNELVELTSIDSSIFRKMQVGLENTTCYVIIGNKKVFRNVGTDSISIWL